MLKDFLAALQTWPKWKRIEESPERIDALENRISKLEKRLERCPGEGCPKCGELAFRAYGSRPAGRAGGGGPIVRTMQCEKCGYSEHRTIVP